MVNFALFIVPLIAGIGLGYLLRNKRQIQFSRLLFWVILVLIFSLGFSIGSNGDLLKALPDIAGASVILVLLTIGFSAVFVKIAMKLVKLR